MEEIAKAINNLAEVVRELGGRIAEGAALNVSFGAGCSEIAEAINRLPASAIAEALETIASAIDEK